MSHSYELLETCSLLAICDCLCAIILGHPSLSPEVLASVFFFSGRPITTALSKVGESLARIISCSIKEQVKCSSICPAFEEGGGLWGPTRTDRTH